MPRHAKSLILSSCVVSFIFLSVPILRGQAPAKKRQAGNKEKAIAAEIVTPVDAPLMRRPEPGSSDAERMAAFVAECKAGRVPVVRIGLPPREDYSKGPKMPDFAPTQVVPQSKASGEMLVFQRNLCAKFAIDDPMPPSRIDHFAWLKGHPNVRIFGWYGTVTGAEVQGDSSVIVTIEFHTKTEIMAPHRSVVPDFVTEKYHIADGKLHLIDTDAAFHDPAKQTIMSF